MNRTCHYLLLLLFCGLFITHLEAAEWKSMQSVSLSISDVKWTCLQFESDVKYADMGTDDILIEVTEVPSIIRLKGLSAHFANTSITIITLDGLVHTFSLQYDPNPGAVAFRVRPDVLEEISSMPLELSDRQTSHILFPEKIVDFMVGCDSIIADKADGIDNIIRCKSWSNDFKETNLTVLTADKMIYSFVVQYKEYPSVVNLQMANIDRHSDALFSSHSVNEPQMKQYGEKVLQKGCVMRNYGTIANKASFSLYGLYVQEDVMMFYLSVENLSKIAYEIDFIKCYITNRKTTKNQAYQADEKSPIFTYRGSSSEVIQASDAYSIVFFYKRFTIPSKHNLYFEVFEKNGGRHLKFTIPNRVLLKAKQLDFLCD